MKQKEEGIKLTLVFVRKPCVASLSNLPSTRVADSSTDIGSVTVEAQPALLCGVGLPFVTVVL